jgi:hypothetical protein
VQTFLPFEDYAESARVLDDKRLRNQRNEAKVLVRTLLGEYGPRGGWPHHPATKMWRGHEGALCQYGIAVCREALVRGWTAGDLTSFFAERLASLPICKAPSWLGDAEFHRAHQSNLLRKLPGHYRTYWPDLPDNLPYVWPQPCPSTQP